MTRTILGVVLLIGMGCSGDEPGDVPSNATPNAENSSPNSEAGAVVGSDGGTVTASGVAMEIPAGALSDDVTITVAVSTTAVPDGITAHSDVYSFGPSGQTFDTPVEVTIPITGGEPMLLAVFFTAEGGGDFEALIPSAADESSVTFEVDHFSEAFIGEFQSCTGEDSCKEDGGCSGDLDCTFGGVCSLKFSDTDWRCLVLDGNCGGRCTGEDTCGPRGLCSSPTM